MGKQFGVSGNRPLWGQLQTGEHISALDGPNGRAIFSEMARGDDRIGAVLEARRLPILRNEYRVDPATDDARDVEIAEFVQDNLFNRMSMSWQDTLRHAMLMDQYGFMVFENLFERSRADGRIRLKKLDPRLPASIQSWHYNGDSLETIEQIGNDGTVYQLPIENCVVLTRNRVGDNWEGTAALRTVYGLWKIKNQMLKVAAIKHDRFGAGTPVATAPESVDATSEAWAAMKTILEDYHANEIGYLMLPAGWDVKILTPDGGKGGTDVEPFIKQLDEGIAISLLAQFLNLGTSATGSRSLGESFLDFFLMVEQETADYICATLNRFTINRLVDYNWADVDEYPKLTAAKIQGLDYQTVAALKTAGVLTADGELENTIRVGLGLPEIEEDAEAIVSEALGSDVQSTALNGAQIASLVSIIAQVMSGGLSIEVARPVIEVSFPSIPKEKIDEMLGAADKTRTKDPAGEPPPEEPKDPPPPKPPEGDGVADEDTEEEPEQVEAHVHPHTYAEPPEEVAAFMQFSSLDEALNRANDELLAAVLEIRAQQTEQLVRQLVAGKAVRQLTVPGKKDMFDDVVRAFKAQVKVGREQVREETARQRPGYSFADPVSDNLFTDLVLEELSLLVEGAGDKLKAVVAKVALDLQKAGFAGEALRTELDRVIPLKIGESTWKDLVGSAINQGWGHGRRLELVTIENDVDHYQRYGILDRNLCSVCASKDLAIVSPSDPEFRVPDPECEGGPSRCRCVIVAIMRSEVAA